MLLKQIEYFVVLAEEKSFTETGYKFNVSQSAISQQLQALEDELGVSLISRQQKKFKLTEAGEYFYNKGKTILAMLENLKKQTADIGKNNDLILNLGFLNSYFGEQLNKAIAKFLKIYSELEINVFSGTHETIYELLKNGDVALALSDQRRAFSEEYENQFALESYYAIYVREDIYNDTEMLDIEKALKLPFIIIAKLEEQQTERNYFNDLLDGNNSYVFVNNLEEAKLLVDAGRGQLLVDGIFNNTKNSCRIIKLIKNGKEIKKRYYVFWKKNKANYYIEELAKLLIEEF